MTARRSRFESQGFAFGQRMLAPSWVVIIVVSIYPLLQGIYLSLTSHDLFKPETWGFIGLGNFVKLLGGDPSSTGSSCILLFTASSWSY